jgi:hypothetical protein
MLEKAIVEKLGYEHMRGRLNPETIRTKFTANIKGIIFGYDNLSGQSFDDKF